MREKKNIFTGISAVLLVWLSLSTGCAKEPEVYLEKERGEETLTESTDSEKEEQPQEKIFVYVCGAVERPGVYELDPNQRVCDALKAAGGLTGDAAQEALNQAEPLSDGQMIRVLTTQEEQQSKEQAQEAESGLVNLNTADADTLMRLPGIGASKAEAILAYRKEHGGFQSIEELMQISGIKEGVYNKIKASITVN